jgi:hypothetical protein
LSHANFFQSCFFKFLSWKVHAQVAGTLELVILFVILLLVRP